VSHITYTTAVMSDEMFQVNFEHMMTTEE